MIVERSMHPDYRSNAYLLADEPGGTGVFIDAGAPVEPLMQAVDRLGIRVTHVLLTHDHHDHTTHAVELEERYGIPQVLAEQAVGGMTVPCGALELRALSTPGHCAPHVAWIVERDGEPVAAFTGDALFRGTVGGTLNGGEHGVELLRASILDGLLTLPATVELHPGHMDPSTVAHERDTNPFVLAWAGSRDLGDEQVTVAGNTATLLLQAPDYDGGTKNWVRFEDGREAIVGGSMVGR